MLSRMPSAPVLAQHVLVALIVAFGLSVIFWLFLGVFVLSGFVLWSLVSAVIGVLIGAFVFDYVVWTATATAIVRVAIYLGMTQI